MSQDDVVPNFLSSSSSSSRRIVYFCRSRDESGGESEKKQKCVHVHFSWNSIFPATRGIIASCSCVFSSSCSRKLIMEIFSPLFPFPASSQIFLAFRQISIANTRSEIRPILFKKSWSHVPSTIESILTNVSRYLHRTGIFPGVYGNRYLRRTGIIFPGLSGSRYISDISRFLRRVVL